MYLSVVVIVVWQNLGKKLDVDEVGAGWSAKLVDRKKLETEPCDWDFGQIGR